GEDDHCYDEEIQYFLQEHAVIQSGGARLLGGGQGRVTGTAQIDEQALDIDLAHEEPDGRHDDVVDQGRDDVAEGCPDDDADGQIQGVALHGEFLKFIQYLFHPIPPDLSAST